MYDQQIKDAVGTLPSEGWARINCPGCPERVGKEDRKRAMSVSEAGYYQCHRCGLTGWIDGVRSTIAYEARQLRHVTETAAVALPDGSVPVWEDAHDHRIHAARRYLLERIGPRASEISQAVGIHVCLAHEGPWRSRIIVPFRKGGVIVGYQGRTFTPCNAIPYLNCKHMPRIFWNDAAVGSPDLPFLLVVEGVFDALPYFPYAVACNGKPSAAQRDRLLDAKVPIVVALDWDATAEAAGLTLALMLKDKRAHHIELPEGHDPGSLDPAWLLARAREAVTLCA